MAILELRLLGGYEGSFASDEALRPPTRKAWALLAYLALHPAREISRERLATLLWGERFDEQARASLRQTLYELRSALGERLADHLIANRDSIALLNDGIEVDVLRLEDLVLRDRVQDLAQITSLYRGPLLDGLDTGEPGFDEWLAGERARLQDLVCGALERLASAHLEQGHSEAAIETAQHLIRLDPLREKAHRLLMRGLAAEGRRSEALKQFQDLERILEAELGVTPDPETVRLRDELVRDGDTMLSTRSAVRPDIQPGPGTTEPDSVKSARTKAPWRIIAAASMFSLGIALAGLWVFYPGEREKGAELASEANLPLPLPNKPSIAVLPFENLSGDPQQVYLADGLTEDLITALSKASQLLVIARTSVAGYKGKSVKVQSIAEDLGVRYVLEGSVQKSGENLRITTQLIDAISGHHLWSERFDRKASQFFALQDDIVRLVLIELQVKLTDGEHARVASRGTTNLDAWLLRLQGMTELYKFTRESTVRTREIFQAAHELDPNWSRPIAGIAWSYWWEARKGWTDDREEWIRKGIELAEQAIEMNPNDTLGYMQLGNLVQLQGDHDRAVELREKAVEIAPNDFQANWGLGSVLYRAGQEERAVEVLKHANRLSPRQPASLVWTLSQAQLVAGQYKDTIETAKRASALAPDRDIPHIQLTAAYSGIGRMEEARAAAAKVLRIDPKFSVSGWKRAHADYKDQATVKKLANLLTKAGLPE
jgi:TolB-like protein/DNA-binding SARP family transcriptional activator